MDRDKLLIRAALDQLAMLGLPTLAEEGAAVGVSDETIRRWRDGSSSSLNKNSRPKVEGFLRQSGAMGEGSALTRGGTRGNEESRGEVVAQPVTQAQVDAGLPELVRLLELALSMDGEARWKAYAAAEVGASYRSYALAKEADNSGARARAVESEGRAAETRLAAISPGAAEAARQDADVASRAVTQEKGRRKRPA
jgi:hypothetical protein